MSKQNRKPDMMSLNLDDIDVRELEQRIELAANAADCSCQASCNGNCAGKATCKPA